MANGVDVSPDEREALGIVLGIAADDQDSYLSTGNPEQDYGEEWPDVARAKALAFRHVAAFARRIGLSGLAKDYEGLADNVEQKV